MPIHSHLFLTEPAWRTSRPGCRRLIPASAQSWIYEPDSLTQRLRDYYGDAVSVAVLFQQRSRPFFSERRLLKLDNARHSLVREVLLYAEDRPLILARTVIPEKTLKGAQRNLARLGNRPLGEVIFSHPKLERLEMDITRVQPYNWSKSVRESYHLEQPLWGRRTVYALQHRQLLVSEFFLPEVLAAHC